VIEEMTAWQTRPLEPVYLIAYLDALVIKVRDKSGVQNKSVYIVVGVRPDGSKDVLGFWIQATEGAKFWLTILTELRQRGVEDILVLCADGLTGMAEAVEAAFPRAIFQTCIVHMVRSSTRFVPWKERKAVCADLRTISHRRDGRGRGGGTARLRTQLGQALSDDRARVGERAVDIVQLAAIVIASQMTVDTLAYLPFSFPTHAIILGRAAVNATRQLSQGPGCQSLPGEG
jgi:transposase-like protein